MRELGYVEGRNIVVEYRYAAGKFERLADLAAELVDLKVNVIVAHTTPGAMAAKRATTTIPVVMTNAGDPVGSGLVSSLAKPGGNITGMSMLNAELGGKRLEILKEVIPRLSRVYSLWNPSNHGNLLIEKNMEPVARALNIRLQSLETRTQSDLDAALKAIQSNRGNALNVVEDPITVDHRQQIAEFAVKNALPAIYGLSQFVDAGGLLSYGIHLEDLFRRAATYVDKILKGVKPADLPVEQPMKFEFIVSLKAAKQIGLTIPPNVLVRADKVIR
jgi:putative ABC transport system substrate-binding protein